MHDPFSILGLPARFDLDLAEAEKRHRELSRALHPDRFAQSTAGERRAALGKAIEVNEAWRILKDPIRRGEALLAQLGVHVEEGREPKPDPELLMEMMEKREALAEAGRARDEARLRALTVELGERQKRLTAALASTFREAEASADRSRLAVELLRKLSELRYYRRFLEEAATLEDELF